MFSTVSDTRIKWWGWREGANVSVVYELFKIIINTVAVLKLKIEIMAFENKQILMLQYPL